MNALIVAGATVRVDAAGRYNLNDLHHAGGSKPKHRPSLWLANQQTQELVNELNAEAGNPALAIQRGGAASGSYGCREIALAYAAWIAPAFHVRVLRAADAAFRGREQPAQQMQAALNDPATLRALLLNQADACIRLESEAGRLQVEVDRQAPKVAAFQRLDSAHEAVSMTEAAKILGMKPTQFFAWLSELKWTYRASDAGSWLGYARYCDAGYLEHRLVTPKHSERQRVQVLVTTRGIAQLALLLERKSLPRSKNPTPATSTYHR